MKVMLAGIAPPRIIPAGHSADTGQDNQRGMDFLSPNSARL